MRRAILHIGTEKTGTSTLQMFLMENRVALARSGFHYARFAGNINHTRLTAYAAADDVKDDLRIDIGATDPQAVAAFRERFAAEAAAELAEAGERVVLFSNEHCSSRLTTAAEIGRLKALLDRFFDRITVAVYLRRQDQIAVSLYSTLLKFGGNRREILPDPHVRPDYWNYGLLLERWAATFGRENVVPRIFDRDSLVGRSVVSDFCDRWGLGSGYQAVADANESLQPVAQEVLRRMNEAFPGYVDGDLNRMRGELGGRIGQLYPGRGARPARADAEAFYRRFADANEIVRAEWFPERETLFSEDFSAYPDDGDRRDVTFDEAIEVMIALWRVTQGKELQLRHDLALKEGRIAELTGDLAAARTAYAKAVRLDPTRPKARNALAAVDAAVAAPVKAQPAPDTGEVAVRWAREEREDRRASALRKRLSLNGIRRIFGAAPR